MRSVTHDGVIVAYYDVMRFPVPDSPEDIDLIATVVAREILGGMKRASLRDAIDSLESLRDDLTAMLDLLEDRMA